MTLSLDHLFIITEPGAAIGDRLLALGMVEGNANTHPGQGTANRRFFFEGFTLELLFVSDAKEAATGAGRKLRILERSHGNGASPFGLVARVADSTTEPEFDSWQYYPDYFNGELCFFVGSNSEQLGEPLCICMPPAFSPSSQSSSDSSQSSSSLSTRSSGNAVDYANAAWRFTSLKISVPVSPPTSPPSAVLQHFASMERVELVVGDRHHLEIQFNEGEGGQSADLSPELPLTLVW